MSRSRPLAVSEQKRFMSSEEVSSIETCLGPLIDLIQVENPSMKRDAQPRTLATLLLQLQVFMDQVLGEKSLPEDRFMVRIPAACFRDFAHPNGSLKHLLTWSLEYRLQNGDSTSRRFELLSDKSRQFATNLCKHLSSKLKSEGLWIPPNVFFWEPHKFPNLKKLQQIVLKHEGTLADSISSASHIILPESVVDHTDQEHYIRTMEHRANKIFVHWWYFPDSYDSWISSHSGSEAVETIMTPEDGKWKLGSEWLLLVEQFNEWMNEADFEVAELPQSLLTACGTKQEKGTARSRSNQQTDRFRVRLGSTDGDVLSSLSDVKKEETKKRGRPSASSKSFPVESVLERERKRSKLSNQGSPCDSAPPGAFVISLTAPGSARGSYDTLRSCSVVCLSPALQMAVAAADPQQALSGVDSDSEETSTAFLASIRPGGRPFHTDIEVKPPGTSVISKSGRRRRVTEIRSPARKLENSPPPPDPIIEEKSMIGSYPMSSVEHSEWIAPNVLRHAHRTVLSSIVTTSKDTFSVLRNMRPSDPQYIASHATPHTTRAAASTQALMALWSTSAFLENSSFAMMKDDDDGLPDVPPVTNSDLGQPVPPWLVSSNQHLSDFERQALESSDSRPPQTNNTETEIVCPSSSNWFDLNKVHQIEKEQLKVLFFGNQDQQQEEQYKTIRNAIIERYRQNPRAHLSVTDCRQIIDGDAALLLRIHSFLDFWGLINFQALPHLRPTRSRRVRDFQLPAHSSWVGSQTQPPTPSHVECVVCHKICLYSYYVLRPGHSTGVSVGLVNQAAWCLRCYANGKYPETLSQRQFLKVTVPVSGSETGALNDWKDSEVEKLIEGIEMFGESWDSVAGHVGTRSAKECVAHFVQLPIDEPIQFESGAQHPLSDAPNPLMCLIKFLGQLLGPNFASVSAKAASDFLLSNFPSTLEGEMLSRPVDYNDVEAASSKALEMAAKFAEQQAKEEENKIAKLLGQLNKVKERQIEEKIRHYHLTDSSMAKASEDMAAKLEVYFATRDDLWSTLTSATEEHQKVISEFHRDRQKRQQFQMQYQQSQHQQPQHQQQPLMTRMPVPVAQQVPQFHPKPASYSSPPKFMPETI